MTSPTRPRIVETLRAALHAARRTRPHVSAGRSGTRRARHSGRRSVPERFDLPEGEAREPKADVSGSRARTPRAFYIFDMLACFARGSGLDCRGGKRRRIHLRKEEHHSYLASASPGTAKCAHGRGGLDGALPESVFLASTGRSLAIFRVRLTATPPSPTPTEEEEQVYAQLATLKDHLPTRYAPRRPGNARVERSSHLPSTRRSAVCQTHSPRFGSRRHFPESSLGRNTEAAGAARIGGRSASTVPSA